MVETFNGGNLWKSWFCSCWFWFFCLLFGPKINRFTGSSSSSSPILSLLLCDYVLELASMWVRTWNCRKIFNPVMKIHTNLWGLMQKMLILMKIRVSGKRLGFCVLDVLERFWEIFLFWFNCWEKKIEFVFVSWRVINGSVWHCTPFIAWHVCIGTNGIVTPGPGEENGTAWTKNEIWTFLQNQRNWGLNCKIN